MPFGENYCTAGCQFGRSQSRVKSSTSDGDIYTAEDPQKADRIAAAPGIESAAVYASWGMLPLPMQDSLPAGWLASAGRELTLWTAMKGFRVLHSLPPFPDLT
jgi:hypothetical protein